MAVRRSLLALLLTVGFIAALSGVAGAADGTTPTGQAAGARSPVLSLPDVSHGEAAIKALGASLSEVAREYGKNVDQLRLHLRSDPSLAVDRRGRLFYQEAPLVSHGPGIDRTVDRAGLQATSSSEGTTTGTRLALAPLVDTFKLHSKPGASRIIYLDFDGHVLSGTVWNRDAKRTQIVCPAYDFEGGASVFTDNERTRIQQAWQRVAEDYAPFDVDVTTEYMGEAAITRSGSSDQVYGMRVLISPISSYFGNYGGIAYVGVFDEVGDYYKPALVFPERLSNGEKYIGEAASHECGHTLGLIHDGITGGAAYYQGHGSGDTGWAPIMGNGYSRNLTQWSKGEYSGANNREDDLAIITATGLSYRTDDHGNTTETATQLSGTGTLAASGLIERTADIDVFAVASGAGTLTAAVVPAERGPDLDLMVEVRDAAGTIVGSANPADLLTASVSVTVPSQGTYYVWVRGVGRTPLYAGYSSYGCLGAYQLSTTAPVSDRKLPPVAVASVTPATGTAPLTVSCGGSTSHDPDGNLASWSWDFGDGATGNGVTVDHTYGEPGTYTVTLTVADTGGLTNSTTTQVTVLPPNTAPEARPAAAPTTGMAPLAVTFDGRASVDPDGTIVTYRWQFGDGATATGPTTSHTYASPGTYTATLTVTDDRGATHSAQLVIQAQRSLSKVIRVAALQLDVIPSWTGRQARATVTVTDAYGAPVTGVVVTGSFSGPTTGTITASTSSAGTAVLTSARYAVTTRTVTFTITKLAKTGYVYDPTLNLVTITASAAQTQ